MHDTVWTLSQTDDLLLYRVHGTSQREQPPEIREQERDLKPSSNAAAADSKPRSRLSRKRSAKVAHSNPSSEVAVKSETQELDAKASPDVTRSQSETGNVFEGMLRDYFRLDVDLDALYCHWTDVGKQ